MTGEEKEIPKEFNPELGFKIQISDDGLTANLIVNPYWLRARDVTTADLLQTIESYNISLNQVDSASLEPIVKHINTTIKSTNSIPPSMNFVIAKGTPPKEGENGWVEFFFPRNQKVKIREDGTADYRNIDKFIHVNKGDKLAILFEGIPGKPGVDVFGNPIPPNPIHKAHLTPGQNIQVVMEKNPKNELTNVKVFYAAINGVVNSTASTISVSPELNIHSDVGLETGNINFEGSVNVIGNISEGSVVQCTGSLYVEGNVESLDVKVKENLTIKGGIKGKDRTKGTIFVGGNLKAKFIENATIEVEGDILIENNILNSHILCLGSVIISSDNGAIVSSDIVCYGGLSTAYLGSSAELDTKIELGFHYKNDRLYQVGIQKLKNLEKDLELLQPKILKIKDIVTRNRGKLSEEQKKDFKVIFDDYTKKKKTIELFNEKLIKLKQERFNKDNVKLVVRTLAYPGSTVRYRKQLEKFTKPTSSFMMNFFPAQEKAIQVAWKSKDSSKL